MLANGRRDFLKAACAVPLALGALPARAARVDTGMIDVHAHVGNPDYLAALAAAGVRSRGYGSVTAPGVQVAGASNGPGSDSDESLAARIALMDAAGVRTQILSPSLAPYVANVAIAAATARLVNERLAVIARMHPGRFAGLASLPLPHVDAAIAELRWGLDRLGLIGVALQSTALGTSIADDRFAPLFAELNRRSAVLFIHPSVNGLHSDLLNNWNLQASAGPLFEDATVVLHLLAKSIPVRFPNLRIVIPHLGGGIATMLERLDNQMKLSIPTLAARPSEMARALWYDTASHSSATALRAAVDGLGADRLVPGSDFPVLLAFESTLR